MITTVDSISLQCRLKENVIKEDGACIDTADLLNAIKEGVDMGLKDVFLGKLVSFTFDGVENIQRQQQKKRIRYYKGISWKPAPAGSTSVLSGEMKITHERKEENTSQADVCVQHDTECKRCHKLTSLLQKEREENAALKRELAELKKRKNMTSRLLYPAFYQRDLSMFVRSENQSNRPDPSGSYGYCQRFIYRQMPVCMKFFHAHDKLSDADHRELVLNEAVALLNIRAHRGIPTLIGVNLDAQPYRLITSFHGIHKKSTTIKYILDRPDRFTFNVDDWLQVISSLVDALSNIHVSTYIHNDLKCNNVIVEEDRTAVIIDYSKSKLFVNYTVKKKRKISEETKEYREKYPWVAPEIVYGTGKPSFASDVYSLGYLILYISRHANISCAKFTQLIEGCMQDIPDRFTLNQVKAILSE